MAGLRTPAFRGLITIPRLTLLQLSSTLRQLGASLRQLSVTLLQPTGSLSGGTAAGSTLSAGSSSSSTHTTIGGKRATHAAQVPATKRAGIVGETRAKRMIGALSSDTAGWLLSVLMAFVLLVLGAGYCLRATRQAAPHH